ncbi:MAG: alpha/beta hydrolase [Microgenomates group bacterium]
MKKEIVMIHGWATRSYNSNLDCKEINEGIAWSQRQGLINILEKEYSIRFFNLPGFCCIKEPQKQAFDLEDFSDYLDIWIKSKGIKPVAIVGYSFGGAVALDYKSRYKSDTKVILISPALKRKETIKSQMGKMGKHVVPKKYFTLLKSIYQYIFNKYHREGTTFMRASYDKIARRDIRSQLEKVNPKEILLIYGDSDTSTPADYIYEIVEKNKLNCFIIKGGNHNIGDTHPEEIFSAVAAFIPR